MRYQLKSHPQIDHPKVSTQPPLATNAVHTYAANTHNGIVRNYNEDRISIVLDLKKPNALHAHRKIQFFAIFDGHGGLGCSQFLRDNLHTMVAQSGYFPDFLEMALKEGC